MFFFRLSLFWWNQEKQLTSAREARTTFLWRSSEVTLIVLVSTSLLGRARILFKERTHFKTHSVENFTTVNLALCSKWGQLRYDNLKAFSFRHTGMSVERANRRMISMNWSASYFSSFIIFIKVAELFEDFLKPDQVTRYFSLKKCWLIRRVDNFLVGPFIKSSLDLTSPAACSIGIHSC